MIPRTIYKNAQFASLNARRTLSATAGGTSSQHLHAQREETIKLDSSTSQQSSNADATSDTPGDSASSTSTSQGGSPPPNAIAIPQLDRAMIQHVIPFNTYQFFVVLEKTFPTPVARTLMRATRGVLVDRILKIKRDALDVKDLDNQAYLFRAALSELRTEATMRTKNQAASITTSISSLRRDLDRLDIRMKEGIGELKHEIQMEMDNYRNESRADIKRYDIHMEDVVHSAMIKVSDIRTEIEQAKWDNTRRGVAIFASFVLVAIVLMELKPSRAQAYPPKAAVDASEGIDVDPVQSTT